MNLYLKIKRLLLAGIIALALLYGTLGATNKVQASHSVQVADSGAQRDDHRDNHRDDRRDDQKPNGACWKCD